MMRLAPLEDEADSVMVIPSSHWSCGYPSGIGIVAILTYFNNQLINLYIIYILVNWGLIRILVLTLTQFHHVSPISTRKSNASGPARRGHCQGSDSDPAKVVVLWECFKFQVPKLDCSTMLQSMPIQISVRLA